MADVIRTPRVNNNDDYVRFSHVFVEAGAAVKTGDPIAEIETDKATFTVEAERDGYILGFTQPLGEMIAVGSVLGWIGNFPDEAVPTDNQPTAHAAVPSEPTLKAARLLAQFGLNANEVPASGERLSAQDVLAYVERHPRTPYQPPAPAAIEPSADLPSGEAIPFSAIERGMMKAVLWHRQSAVAGYVEIQYSTDAWQQYADAFQSHHKLLINPLLPLMAYRLVQLGRENPKLNSTIRGDERYQYANVNLGFTLQSGGSLYLLSVKDAGMLEEKAFVDALNVLMRQGMKGKLHPSQTSGVTIAFSSMSRWEVTRHVPILPPYTSFIAAHAHGANGTAVLGASYDHRVLTGGEAAATLRALSRPLAGD